MFVIAGRMELIEQIFASAMRVRVSVWLLMVVLSIIVLIGIWLILRWFASFFQRDKVILLLVILLLLLIPLSGWVLIVPYLIEQFKWVGTWFYVYKEVFNYNQVKAEFVSDHVHQYTNFAYAFFTCCILFSTLLSRFLLYKFLKIEVLWKLFSGGRPRQCKDAGSSQSNVVVNNHMTTPDSKTVATANLAATEEWNTTIKALTQQLSMLSLPGQPAIAVQLAAVNAAVEALANATTQVVANVNPTPVTIGKRRTKSKGKRRVSIADPPTVAGRQGASETEGSESESESTRVVSATTDGSVQQVCEHRSGTILRGVPLTIGKHILDHLVSSNHLCELYVPSVYTIDTTTENSANSTIAAILPVTPPAPVVVPLQVINLDDRARNTSSKKHKSGEHHSDNESDGSGSSCSESEDIQMQTPPTGRRPYGPAGERYGNTFMAYPNVTPFPRGNIVNRGGRRSRSPATGGNAVEIPKRDLPTIVPQLKDEHQEIDLSPEMNKYMEEYVHLPYNVREGGKLLPREQGLSARELYLFWRRASAIIGGRDRRLFGRDDIPFEELSAYERSLNKKEVKKILYSKRNLAWHLQEVQKGKKTYFCGNCSRYHPEGMTCVYRQYDRPGLPEGTGLLTQSSSRGCVVIPTAPIVDYDELIKEQQKLNERLLTAERERKHAEQMALGVQAYEAKKKEELIIAQEQAKQLIAEQAIRNAQTAEAVGLANSASVAGTIVPSLNTTSQIGLNFASIAPYDPPVRRFSEVCSGFRTGGLQIQAS